MPGLTAAARAPVSRREAAAIAAFVLLLAEMIAAWWVS